MKCDFKVKLFSSQLERLSTQYADRDALTCGRNTLTYSQLKEKADLISLKLINAGLKKGDKVVLWGYNSIEWMMLYWAITQIGGIAVLMNYGLLSKDISSLSNMAGASYGMIGRNKISKNSLENASKALVKGGIPQENIFFFSEITNTRNCTKTDERINILNQMKNDVHSKETQVIIYTTGTSSIPKAVQLSSFAIFSNVEGLFGLLSDSASESFCLALPLYHSYGMTMALFYLMMGKHIYLTPELKPDVLIDLIANYRIQDMSSVGAVYNMMIALPDFEKKISGKMHMCVVGGSFTSPENMIQMEKQFAGAKLICGYGQTECSPVISMESYRDSLEKRAVSVGHILPNHEVKILGENGEFLEQGDTGEIVVRGPSLMNGYLGLPEEKQAVDKNGWLHTEDLGRINEFGMLQFAGRIKDIIIRGGECISPMEIEHAILSEPEIKEVKVIGSPHPIWGENVEACLVINDAPFNESDLRERLEKKLAPFKIPSHFFIYDSLPLSENGKLDQRQLKTDMLNRLKSLDKK